MRAQWTGPSLVTPFWQVYKAAETIIRGRPALDATAGHAGWEVLLARWMARGASLQEIQQLQAAGRYMRRCAIGAISMETNIDAVAVRGRELLPPVATAAVAAVLPLSRSAAELLDDLASEVERGAGAAREVDCSAAALQAQLVALEGQVEETRRLMVHMEWQSPVDEWGKALWLQRLHLLSAMLDMVRDAALAVRAALPDPPPASS